MTDSEGIAASRRAAELLGTGAEPPRVLGRIPGRRSQSLLESIRAASAPMGPPPSSAGAPGMVYAEGLGSNVLDADGNRYVDLAAGFGALLLGHRPPEVVRAVELQSKRLWLALGDVFSSDVKAELTKRLAELYPEPGARVILTQSGADAVTAAIKTAALATGRPGIIAFRGGYHGLSFAPLAASSLRQSYAEPFRAQLNPHVRLVDFPTNADTADRALTSVREVFRSFDAGAVLAEPILGRAGVVIPPPGFLVELGRITRERGALLVADEVWTGLGRSGSTLFSVAEGVVPDVICLGKGLGGGVPVSACLGSESVMRAWQRADEVVHTSTFAGAPMACGAGLATLDVLLAEDLPARSASVGARFLAELDSALRDTPAVLGVRGRGLMIGIELGSGPGSAGVVMGRLLEKGYIVSSGGGRREVVVLTPPLNIDESLLAGFVPTLAEVLRDPIP